MFPNKFTLLLIQNVGIVEEKPRYMEQQNGCTAVVVLLPCFNLEHLPR